MAIKHFTFDEKSSRLFAGFEYELYKSDPKWIPPGRRRILAQLGPHYSFYRRTGNLHRHFLAFSGESVVGRASAFLNADLHEDDGLPIGTIGFFECINDYAVAQDLFDAAAGWLREESRVKKIWGPMNFDVWHQYRLMTSGFEQEPFVGEPYNKHYYPEFFERYGFVEKRKWDSVELSDADDLAILMRRGVQRHQQLVEQGYRFEHLKAERFREELPKLHAILAASFQRALGFTKISYEEFEHMILPMRPAFDPRFTIFAYDAENKLVGFASALIDLAHALRAFRTYESPVATWRFFQRRRKSNRIVFLLGGITLEEEMKASGLGRAGFGYVIAKILTAGYHSVILALRSETSKARGFLGNRNAMKTREYGLFELKVNS